MNGEPHLHDVKITKPWSSSWRYEITYGDTTVHVLGLGENVWRPFGIERAMRRKVKRAVAKHDAGSLRAKKREEAQARLRATFAELKEPAKGDYCMDRSCPQGAYLHRHDAAPPENPRWGSEILADRRWQPTADPVVKA